MSESLVTVTFVRHGESTDNLRTVWAGWADAPLSNHGMNQAKAAGAYFASTNTHFSAIYTSDLKRAHSTAQAILTSHPSPEPPFFVSKDLREQHFGIAEGKSWSLKSEEGISREEQYAKGIFPVIYNRTDKFPGGESLNDLQSRAERAIDEIVMPDIWEAVRKGKKRHLALVSHGLCISELIAALVRKDRDVQSGGGAQGGKWTGLMNTAWTRATIDAVGLKEGESIDVNPSDPPPLKVKVTHINQHSHLDKVKRQQGGIGSAAHDPAQKDIRAFFGGTSLNPAKPSPEEAKKTVNNVAQQPPPVELEDGRAASNAFDEVDVAMESEKGGGAGESASGRL